MPLEESTIEKNYQKGDADRDDIAELLGTLTSGVEVSEETIARARHYRDKIYHQLVSSPNENLDKLKQAIAVNPDYDPATPLCKVFYDYNSKIGNRLCATDYVQTIAACIDNIDQKNIRPQKDEKAIQDEDRKLQAAGHQIFVARLLFDLIVGRADAFYIEMQDPESSRIRIQRYLDQLSKKNPEKSKRLRAMTTTPILSNGYKNTTFLYQIFNVPRDKEEWARKLHDDYQVSNSILQNPVCREIDFRGVYYQLTLIKILGHHDEDGVFYTSEFDGIAFWNLWEFVAFSGNYNALYRLFNRQGNTWYMQSCDLVHVSDLTDIPALRKTKLHSTAAYVQCGDQLFYVDRVNQGWVELTTFPEKRDEFNKKFSISDVPRTLSIKEFKEIIFLLGYTPVMKNVKGRSLLHYIAWSGNLDTFRWVVKESGIDIGVIDNIKRTVLFYAVMSGQLELVKYLLAKNLSVVDYTGMSDHLKDLKKVKNFITKKLPVADDDKDGANLLYYAAAAAEVRWKSTLDEKRWETNVAVLQYLIAEQGLDPQKKYGKASLLKYLESVGIDEEKLKEWQESYLFGLCDPESINERFFTL